MPQLRLSAIVVRQAICPPDQAKLDLFDLHQSGFLLEVRRTGGKTYYQRYLDKYGRVRQFRIGPASVLGLSAARRRGKQIVAQALMGTDPREQRAELRAIPTLKQLARDRYLPHVQAYKKSWKTDETILRVHVLPVLGDRHLDELRADAIAALVQQMHQKGYATGTTNRVVIVLRHLYNLAKKWRVPGSGDNPTDGLTIAPDVCRERFLSLAESERLLASIEQDENRVAGQAIVLLLCTGARRNEVTYAKWDQVDWQRQVLLVPISKSGKPRAISLGRSAIELLQSIQPVPGNPYIFPSPITGRPSSSLHFPWERIRKRANLLDLRLHDLRHSFASFLVNRGSELYTVQKLLGHQHSRYTQRYAHLTSETLQEAVDRLPAFRVRLKSEGL